VTAQWDEERVGFCVQKIKEGPSEGVTDRTFGLGLEESVEAFWRLGWIGIPGRAANIYSLVNMRGLPLFSEAGI
jgi:hypothetical protein